MFRTLALGALGLAVAAGAPAAYHTARDYFRTQGKSFWSSTTAESTEAESKAGKSRTKASAPSDAPPEGTPVAGLLEVLRFDISPAWVMGRWPRVSTGMGQLQLQGYRVPLVTGKAEDDLAGALTYYFNPQQQLQRIAFYGTTGNPQKLVGLLGTRFGFARRIVNDAGLFVYEVPHSDGAAKSVLQIQAAGVIKQSEPYRRYTVSLVIERPEA